MLSLVKMRISPRRRLSPTIFFLPSFPASNSVAPGFSLPVASASAARIVRSPRS